MGVNKLAALYAAVGAVLILIVGFASESLAILLFILVNILLLVLYATDYIVTPSMTKFDAERVLDMNLSLSAENTVEIIVKNNGNKTVTVKVQDDVPEHFLFSEIMPKKVKIPAKSYHTFTYTVTPLKRGAYLFPAVHVKIFGILGLCTKQKKFITETKYRVYPNMKDITKYRLSSVSKNMFFSGIKKVRTVANGGEFNSLREYTPEDAYNAINWAATSRKGEVIVNTYTPEKNQHVYVMMDSSRVMNTEIEHIKKLDYSINACFLLADYCIRGGDNIGLTVFDNDIQRFLRAGKGDGQMDILAQSLYDVECSETSANYEKAFVAFNSAVKRRSLIFIFTELFNADEAVRFVNSVKKHLGRHLVCTITINNPKQRALAEGETENHEEKNVYVQAAAVKFMQDRKKIKGILNAAGIMNMDVAPDKLSLSLLASYLDIKRSGLL